MHLRNGGFTRGGVIKGIVDRNRKLSLYLILYKEIYTIRKVYHTYLNDQHDHRQYQFVLCEHVDMLCARKQCVRC